MSDGFEGVFSHITAREHRIWWLITGVVIDRLVTITFWNYEQNPIVQSLGMLRWLLLTGIVLGVAVAIWEFADVYTSRIGVDLVSVVGVAHVAVAGINIGYVLVS